MMNTTLPNAEGTSVNADSAAEQIVRHFQAQGFSGITEALILQIFLKKGIRAEVEAAFENALEQDREPPLGEFFEIKPYGHFSEIRNFDEALSAIHTDFTQSLRSEIARLYFDQAPVVIDDALAIGTKYDVMMKLKDNADGHAIAILMNDPNASFLDYIGTKQGDDWQNIMGSFEIATESLGSEIDLGQRAESGPIKSQFYPELFAYSCFPCASLPPLPLAGEGQWIGEWNFKVNHEKNK